MNEYSIFLQNYKLNVYSKKIAYIELYNKDNKNHSQFNYSEVIIKLNNLNIWYTSFQDFSMPVI